jgi:hypothetical protein
LKRVVEEIFHERMSFWVSVGKEEDDGSRDRNCILLSSQSKRYERIKEPQERHQGNQGRKDKEK